MRFAGRRVLRRSEMNCCPLSQENQGNCVLKRLKLTQSSRSRCREPTGALMVNSPLHSFHLHLSTFTLSHHCNAQQNPVRSKPQRMHQGQTSPGRKPHGGFWGWEAGGGTATVRHHILTNCDGEQAATRLWSDAKDKQLGPGEAKRCHQGAV